MIENGRWLSFLRGSPLSNNFSLLFVCLLQRSAKKQRLSCVYHYNFPPIVYLPGVYNDIGCYQFVVVVYDFAFNQFLNAFENTKRVRLLGRTSVSG